MDRAWNHKISSSNIYLTAKVQPWTLPDTLFNLCQAESMVSNMPWEVVVAQPTLASEPALHYVDYRSVRFVYDAAAGRVTAHGFAFNLIN